MMSCPIASREGPDAISETTHEELGKGTGASWTQVEPEIWALELRNAWTN